MIVYYSYLHMNDEFNKDILIDMFIDWINRTRNRMEGLEYHEQLSFTYSKDRKTLKIENFEEHNILGIQFTTTDNRKSSTFIVEVLYSYMNQTLELGFYKEMNEDAGYIAATSIPVIFEDILSCEYVLKDNDLTIQKKPYFMNTYDYKKIKNRNHQFPIAILNRNRRCILDPNILNEKIYGIGHVICVNNKNTELTAKIIYPDGFVENIEQRKPHHMIAQMSEKMRNYMIQENNQGYSFDELMTLRLQKQHETIKESTNEFKDYFLNEINTLEQEIQELKEEYSKIQEIYNKTKEENDKLTKRMNSQYKESLLITTNKEIEESQKVILNILKRKCDELPLEDNFRKRDILQSILRSQK